MNESYGKQDDKKKIMKDLIRKLHEGTNPEDAKREFRQALTDVTPVGIAQVEEELVNEGMPVEEVHRLCDVHLAVFRESLEKEMPPVPPGHPIYILMEEHKILLGLLEKLSDIARKIEETVDLPIDKNMEEIKLIADLFRNSESHYLREENVLFPYLEKHGITQPPAIMWTEHNKIRETEKDFYGLIDNCQRIMSQDLARRLREISASMSDILSSHFYKENHILFPTSLKVLEEL